MYLGDSRQNIGLAVGGGVMGVLPGTLSKDNTFKRDFGKIILKNVLSKKQGWNVCVSLSKAD